MKKLLTCVLVLGLMLSLCVFPATAASNPEAIRDRLLSYYKTGGKELVHWWEIVALANDGQDLGQYELPEMRPEDLENGITTYVGYIYAFAAMGQSPRNAFGRIDLLSKLAAKQQEDGSFGYINEHVYAMLALDHFEEPYENIAALKWLLEQQQEDGSFTYNPEWGGDLDLTAMVLSTLAPYAKRSDASASIRKAVKYLQENQLENGGFVAFDVENSNTISAAIIGLTDVGENVQSDKWKGMLDALSKFQLEDGSFVYQIGEKEANRFATYQALTALDAALDGKSMWFGITYTYSDIERIYKDGGAISKEYVPAVTTLAQKGIMEGIYGRFEPQSTLTRAQFMKLLCAVLKPEPGRTVMTFRDVTKDQWHYAYLAAAYDAGWIKGKSETYFGADDPVTKEEAALILDRALSNISLPIQRVVDLKDADQIASYAVDAVKNICKRGLMETKDGKFQPTKAVTREEAAQILYQLLKGMED